MQTASISQRSGKNSSMRTGTQTHAGCFLADSCVMADVGELVRHREFHHSRHRRLGNVAQRHKDAFDAVSFLHPSQTQRESHGSRYVHADFSASMRPKGRMLCSLSKHACHDFQSTSVPLNVRGFSNNVVSASAVGACLGVLLLLLLLSLKLWHGSLPHRQVNKLLGSLDLQCSIELPTDWRAQARMALLPASHTRCDYLRDNCRKRFVPAPLSTGPLPCDDDSLTQQSPRATLLRQWSNSRPAARVACPCSYTVE